MGRLQPFNQSLGNTVGERLGLGDFDLGCRQQFLRAAIDQRLGH